MKSPEKQLEAAEPVATAPEIPPKAYEFLLDWDAQFKGAFRQELLARKVDSSDYVEVAARCFVNLMRTHYRIDVRQLCADEEISSRESSPSTKPQGPLPSPSVWRRLQEYLVNPIP